MQQSIEVRAPFDGKLLTEMGVSTESEIEAAFSTAYRLFKDKKGWPDASARIGVLQRARDLAFSRKSALAGIVASESGKPLKDSVIEVDRAINCLEICIHELFTDGGHVVPMGLNATSASKLAFTQYEPIGVVLGISAFNHPFNLVMHQVAPAVAVGAPVVIKPSSKTPMSCKALIEIFEEAGLEQGWAQMVLPTSKDLFARMVSDPRVAFLSFIGSAQVGWQLRSQLAAGARCALEHGGVAPIIVAEDADLEDAITRLARASFWHAGQACVSAQRIYCHESVLERFSEGLAEAGRNLVTGDPLLTSTDVGPLISHSELRRVDSWVKEAITEGATPLSGAQRISESCYENTVLLNPDHASKVSRQEIFGPVTAVYGYRDIDQAIKIANDLDFSFQASIFTNDFDRAIHAYRHLDATAVMVNEHPLFRVDWMPFAGAKQSGLGVGGISHTMADMRTEKMMVARYSPVRSK